MTKSEYESPELLMVDIEGEVVCSSRHSASFPDGWDDEDEWEE